MMDLDLEYLRLKELESYDLLESDSELCFDEITKLAAIVCQTEISLISLVDKNRQWFKSKCGLEAQETPRENSFCNYAIKNEGLFQVEDATVDDRFKSNPLVLGEPHIRFYGSISLVSENGFALGTLCVISSKKMQLNDTQIETLKILARQVVTLFEYRKKSKSIYQQHKQSLDIQAIAKTGGWEIFVDTQECICSKGVYDICALPQLEILPLDTAFSFYPPQDQERIRSYINRCIELLEPFDDEFNFIDAQGTKKWVRATGKAERENGRVVKLIGILQDITLRKEGELSLLKHSREIETYAKGLDQNVLVLKISADGRITFANENFCQNSGYSLLELQGRIPSFLKTDVHSKEYYLEMLSKIQQKHQWRGEMCLKAKNGQLFWVDTTLTPIVALDDSEEVNEYLSFMYDITRSKILERKLAGSEERYRKMFDYSYDPMMTLSPPNWKFSSCNDAALKLLQVPSYSEFTKLSPADISPAFQADGVASEDSAKLRIKEALKNGSSFFDWTHRRFDGSLIHCTVLLSKININDEVFLQATVRDISAQIRAEDEIKLKTRELIASRAYLSLALESSNLGIWDWDIKNDVLNFDRRWGAILGLPADSSHMSVAEWEKLVHPDDLENCLNNVNECLNGQRSFYENIHRIKRSDGCWRYVLDRGRVTECDPAGNPLQFLGTYYDITEQKNKDILVQNISELRAQYVEYFDLEDEFLKKFLSKVCELTESRCALFYKSSLRSTTQYVGYNNADEKLVEYALLACRSDIRNDIFFLSNEFIGYNFFEGEDFLGTLVFCTKQSSAEYYEQLRLRPYLTAACGILNSYSMRSKLNEQTIQAMQHSRLAAIGELAAGVGHEINNPTAIILGFITLGEKAILDNNFNEQQFLNYLQKIKQSALRISKIVKGLRGFARHDDDKTETFDLNELAKDTVEMISEIYSKEGISLKYESSCEHALIHGRRGRLQQVIVNLVANAKDATMGKEQRNVSLLIRGLHHELIQLEVRDNGFGIPDDVKDRIFDPFFTTKPVNVGTGIGLPLAESIVKEHSGQIYFKTQEGVGTSFFLDLPLSSSPISVADVETEVDLKDENETYFNKAQILIIDDEIDLGNILASILKRQFKNVVAVSNVANALSEIEQKNFDLVISDINMPDGNGFDLRDKVNLNRHLPFVFMSGKVALDQNLRQISEDRNCEFLPKPFTEREITEVVLKTLKKDLAS